MKMLKEKAKTLNISDPVVLELWVRAGGRCEFLGCGDYLLQDSLTTNRVKIADIAHIVARSPDGARGDDSLPIEKRNEIDNLMLSCLKHHRMIDSKKIAKQYPKELLISYKKEHEDRIRYLTNFGPESETVILRMISCIRGDSISISDEQVRESVLQGANKYPRYLGGENTIEINLIDIPQENDEQYWSSGKARIDELVKTLISPQICSKKIKHISIFALARIPFLIHLGHAIGDKVPVDLYQKHRNEGENWIWPEIGNEVGFNIDQIRLGRDKIKVALILSLSGKICTDQLPFINDDFSIYEITPNNVDPSRTIISSRSSLEAFRTTYQKLLRHIEHVHYPTTEIHFIPALPVSAAMICGRELLKDISPSLLIYEKVGENYKLSTKIN